MAEVPRNAHKQIYEKDGDNANNLQEEPLALIAETMKPAFVSPKQQCKVLKDVFLESIKEHDYFAMSNDGLEKVMPSVEKDFERTPPSPPPPTPVALKPLNNDKAAVFIGKNSIHEDGVDDGDSAFEKWKDISTPPPPPPLPSCRFLSNGFNYFNAKKLKDALEEAIIKLEAKQETKVNESRRVLDNIDICLRTDKLEMSDVQNMEPCVNKSLKESLVLTPSTATSKAIVVHPKNSKPENILLIERSIKINKLMEKQKQTHSPITTDAIPMPAPIGYDVEMHKDELSLKVTAKPSMSLNLNVQQSNTNTQQSDDEVHLLQSLPARSSTPYTLALVSGTGDGVDLQHQSHYIHAVEENCPPSEINEQKFHQQEFKERDSLAPDSKSSWESSEVSKLPGPSSQYCKILHYSRANMLEIRNDMINAFNACSQELGSFMPHIATCDDIELEARLRRLNLWRMVDVNTKHVTRTTGKFKLRQTADCNPQHFKSRNKPQVVMDDSIIKSEPPQPELKENTMVHIPRRIGSGRLHQSKWSHNANYNKSYHQPTSAVKQHDNNDVSTRCLLQSDGNSSISNGKMITYPSRTTSTTQPLSISSNRPIIKDIEKSNEIDRSLNKNYVKRVMSGFLFVSNPKSRETEEKYNRRYRNQSEEPEWFSSGPTSRLDTIELCGFDDDKELLSSPTESEEKTKSNLYIQENVNIPCKWQSNSMIITKNIAKNNCEESRTNYIPQMKVHVHSENITSQQQMQDDKLPKRSSLYDQFDNSSTDNNIKPLQQPPRQNCQLNYPRSTGGDDTTSFDQEQLSNSSSKFMSFFGAKRTSSSASLNEKSDKSGLSKTLHKFFKSAANVQHNQIADQFVGSSTATIQNQSNLISQMPSVDQLEAKWRKNSLISSNESDRKINNKGSNTESFQKLIGTLNTCTNGGAPAGLLNEGINVMERQQQKQTIAHPQLLANGSANLNNFAINNMVFQQQQLQQQQQKQQMLIQQQQKHASILASLQLKSILSRADTQVLLLRLAKGEISKHGLLVQLANPHLPSHDRDTITAVLQFTNTQQQQQHHQQQLEILSNNLITTQLQNLHNLSVMQQSFARQQQQIHWNQKQHQQHQISQEDLQTRTNLIMQNALLKRKFKEESSKLLQYNATAPVVKPQQYSNTYTGAQRLLDGPTSHSGHAVSTFVQQPDNNRNIMHSQYHPEVVNNMNADEALNKFAVDVTQQQWSFPYYNFKPSRQQQSQKYIANNKPYRTQKLGKQPCPQ